MKRSSSLVESIALAVVAGILAISAVLLIGSAFAKDVDWDNVPNSPEVRRWFRELMQPDNPMVSCCGESDAYYADSFEVSPDGKYIAIITDTRDVPNRPTIAPGTKIVVPNHKLKFDRGNPTGHGVIFVSMNLDVYCYVTPSGI